MKPNSNNNDYLTIGMSCLFLGIGIAVGYTLCNYINAPGEKPLSKMTIEDLQERLDEHVQNEEYEAASVVKKEIDSRQKAA